MAATAEAETKTLEAKCFCGSVHFTFTLPAAALPLPYYTCHCSICRYATGTPCVFHAVLDKGITPTFVAPSSEKNLTSYQTSAEGTYDFCATCGCHVAGVSFARDDWTISTSMFLDQGPENFKLVAHCFTESAPGTALDSALSKIDGRDMKLINPSGRTHVDMPEKEVGPDGQDRLRAQCHCGGVSFTFGRPSQKVLDDEFLSKYVSPRDKRKWIAIYDVCDDCRLVNGTHIASWTFVPLSLCEPSIKPDLRIGTSKTYSSSEGVLRSFCGTCGATVFYSCEGRNPTQEQAVVDVAVGILRCPDSVMGHDWFTWRARLGYEGSGIRYDAAVGEALRDGMETWCKEKYDEPLTMQIE